MCLAMEALADALRPLRLHTFPRFLRNPIFCRESRHYLIYLGVTRVSDKFLKLVFGVDLGGCFGKVMDRKMSKSDMLSEFHGFL